MVPTTASGGGITAVSAMLATATEVAAPVAPIDAEAPIPLIVPATMEPVFWMAPVLVAAWNAPPVPNICGCGGVLTMLVTETLATAPAALARTEAPVPEML